MRSNSSATIAGTPTFGKRSRTSGIAAVAHRHVSLCALGISGSSHSAILPALSIAAIDHTVTTLSTTVAAPAKAIAATVTTPIETRQDGAPAASNTAGEDVDAPWSRAIAAPIEFLARTPHLLRLSHPVIFGVGHWCVVHIDGCCSGFVLAIAIAIAIRV